MVRPSARKTPHRLGVAPVLLVLVALLALGCGSSGDDADPVTTASPTTSSAVDVEPTSSTPADTGTGVEPTPTEPAAPVVQLTIDADELPPAGDGFRYVAWHETAAGSTALGELDADRRAQLTPAEPPVDGDAVVVSLEAAGAELPATPGPTRPLAGTIEDGRAVLATSVGRAVGLDFADAAGRYILATPTNDTDADERSGIWWTAIPRAQSLFLPQLPAGWVYEGWVVIDGQVVTSGRFSDPFAADESAPFSGPLPGPPLVGEDYLLNAPAGLEFPTDLRGSDLFISVEPQPDPSPEAFPIQPLWGTVPADADDHVEYAVGVDRAQFPTGSAEVIGG